MYRAKRLASAELDTYPIGDLVNDESWRQNTKYHMNCVSFFHFLRTYVLALS